ncbi:hypothetical protein EU528_12185 [Candidatus Thorarchaeota archaeon]|nr:MAG: hypothetical protein EU528_12185 [Candidatus Thorarchaeota archaeon]
MYEYWEAWMYVPWFIVGSQQIWKCSGIRGGTIELCSPSPDIHRSKTSSDDSVSLNPKQTKYLIYNQMSDKSFKFDVGAKLKRPWTGPIGTVVEFEVPLISISHITGHYSDTETVYTLTSTANYYHIWDIYEFGCNYGTSGGFVPTFSVYS